MLGLDPQALISGLSHKLQSMPEHFWIELENRILDVIDGDVSATAYVLELMGIEHHH